MKLKDAVAQVTINNEEVYVGFELAKLAAEKGFNYFCEGTWTHYLKTTEFYKKNTYSFESRGVLHDRNEHHEKNEYYEIYSAPTQAVLQKWLREKQQIYVDVIITTAMIGEDLVMSYEVQVKTIVDFKIVFNTIMDEFSSYEKALEMGLKEAIELIK